ncbi:Protein of unknown function [Pyronema omphalodes CBS 100304]|uniref:Uncharacterized protein n=1 Tax=Pyronema omphalodes (strain CBS 100304) TaxID=1076935 RepID=U4LWB9_PYROM|nr:Protein of unknown function [Pyronema omphalodes CBS 100304]
MIFQSKSHR